MSESTVSPIKGVKSSKLVWGGIFLFIILIAVLAYVNRPREFMQEGTVVVKAGETMLGSFTIADLEKLPAVEKKMVIHSSRGDSNHNFIGTPLLGVLNSIEPGLSRKYTRIITRGIDNYTSGLNMSEVMQADNVYVVYSDSGQPIKSRNGKGASMQVIICNDEFGQRFTTWLVSLELQN